MPAILESCVSHLLDKGYPEDSAYPICRTSLNLKEKEGQDSVIKYAEDIATRMKKGLPMNDAEMEHLKKERDSHMYSLKGVEIFAVGEWNGDEYSESDLDNIVDAFEETKDITKPYLKLGHSEKQKLLSEDELPAAGYIENIYKRGQKILADFAAIPKKIYELIVKGAYTKVSSEIFVNFKSNGVVYPYALKAVALLGASTPAVHTLKDILALYKLDQEPLKLEYDLVKAFELNISEVNLNTEDNTMTLDELTRQNAKLEAENKSLETENAELEKDFNEAEKKIKTQETTIKEYKEKSEILDKKIIAIHKESQDKEIEAEVKSYVISNKIVPAQAPFLIELLKNVRMNEETKVFTINKVEFSDVKSLVKAFIDAHVDGIVTGEKSKSNNEKIDHDEDKFLEEVKKYAKENKVSYKEAFLILSPKNSPENEE